MSGELLLGLALALLAGGAAIIYLIARLFKAGSQVLGVLTALLLAVALFLLAGVRTEAAVSSAWARLSLGSVSLLGDPGALVVGSIALGLGSVVAFYSGRYIADGTRTKLYYPLLVLVVLGVLGMVMAGDLFSLYLFCELMSISAYTLVAFQREQSSAIEAAFKYLIIGSVGNAFLLFGISFVYRANGSLLLIPGTIDTATSVWAQVGIVCMLIGLGVKSAIVPLHTWLPDAYGRAPSSVSAMLAGIVSPGAFYALLKIGIGLGFRAQGFGLLLIALSLLNMAVGNLMALVQTDIKRLLAFSSVAHVGYVMFGIGMGLRYSAPDAIQAGFYMLFVDAVMKGLAFMCTGAGPSFAGEALSTAGSTGATETAATEIAAWRGVTYRLPVIGSTLVLSLAGLAAVPPLAGFVGKWLTLERTLRQADPLALLTSLFFLLNGLVALGYYLPLIGLTFSRPFDAETPDAGHPSPWLVAPLLGLAVLVVVIGIYPAPWLEWLSAVGPALLTWGR